MSRISVVIPLYNDGETIEACVESVLTQEPAPLEVVVVDNASSDDGPERVRRLALEHESLKLVYEAKRSPGSARNRGWPETRGELVAFIDADCIAQPGWLAEVKQAFDDPQVGVVGGRIRGSKPTNAVEKALAITATQDPHPPYIFSSYDLVRGGLPSANIAARKQVLDQIGGFDHGFRVGQDHDLCARTIEAGWLLRFAPEATVLHQNHGTVRGQIRQSYGYGTAHAHLLKRHGRPGWLVVIPRNVLRWQGLAGRVWLALDSPGKIVPSLLVATLISGWFAPLLAGYLLHYVRSTHKLLLHHQIPVRPLELLRVAACRALRGVGIDAGRLVGSLRYRVVCI